MLVSFPRSTFPSLEESFTSFKSASVPSSFSVLFVLLSSRFPQENINLYLEACWKLGVPKNDIFVTSDLHGRRNMSAVVQNLCALSRAAPALGVTAKPIVRCPPLISSVSV